MPIAMVAAELLEKDDFYDGMCYYSLRFIIYCSKTKPKRLNM